MVEMKTPRLTRPIPASLVIDIGEKICCFDVMEIPGASTRFGDANSVVSVDEILEQHHVFRKKINAPDEEDKSSHLTYNTLLAVGTLSGYLYVYKLGERKTRPVLWRSIDLYDHIKAEEAEETLSLVRDKDIIEANRIVLSREDNSDNSSDDALDTDLIHETFQQDKEGAKIQELNSCRALKFTKDGASVFCGMGSGHILHISLQNEELLAKMLYIQPPVTEGSYSDHEGDSDEEEEDKESLAEEKRFFECVALVKSKVSAVSVMCVLDNQFLAVGYESGTLVVFDSRTKVAVCKYDLMTDTVSGLYYDRIGADDPGAREHILNRYALNTSLDSMSDKQHFQAIREMEKRDKQWGKYHLVAVSREGTLSVLSVSYNTRKRMQNASKISTLVPHTKFSLKLLKRSEMLEDGLSSVGVFNNGLNILAASEDGPIYVFDWGLFGTNTKSINVRSVNVEALVPAGSYFSAVASGDNCIRILDIARSDCNISYKVCSQSSTIDNLSFYKGNIFSSSHDHTIKVWDLIEFFRKSPSYASTVVENGYIEFGEITYPPRSQAAMIASLPPEVLARVQQEATAFIEEYSEIRSARENLLQNINKALSSITPTDCVESQIITIDKIRNKTETEQAPAAYCHDTANKDAIKGTTPHPDSLDSIRFNRPPKKVKRNYKAIDPFFKDLV